MPLGVEVAIDRDVFGKPRSITRSGNGKSLTRSYVYDAAQRLCKTIEPETKATVQDYDDAGNVAWRAPGLSLLSTTDCSSASVPAARKISYQYDPLNRLGQTTFGDGSPLIKREYTPDGLPYTITSNGATWTNSYNKRRLNEQESLVYGGVTYSFDRRYDANGSLLKVKYPQDSTWLDYNPNALGEPRQVGAYATGIAYHPTGAIAAFRYGNGIAHSLSQNRRGLPEWSQDVGILKDNYGYDENGNVTSIADWQEGITNRGIEYDDLDRLVHVNSAKLWGDAWYSYDALDNLVSSRLVAGGTARNLTHTIDPATSRVASVSNSAGSGYNLSLQYDDNGNVKQRGGQSYVFDLGNRLASAPGKGTYVYDGLGHRVSVVGTDGVNRIQVYSQDGKLLYTKPSNAANGTKYIHLHNHVIAEVTGTAVQYDHTDGLGSPVALTDATGKLISRTRYEPYGATAAGATPGIGFTGHMNAPELGLVYMQQRYYDPVAGRFLSIDPVTTDANTGSSFNRYAYANNSPFKYVDPDGRYSEVTWNSSGTAVTVKIPFAISDPTGVARFTPAQVASEVGRRLSGHVVINGVNVSVKAVGVHVPLTSGAVATGKANVVNVNPNVGRSSTNAIGGDKISLRGTAEAPVVVHELAHSAKGGDQYPGGVSADGKVIPSSYSATKKNIMGDGTGNANAQTLREIAGPPPPPPPSSSKWD
jgi:RHS repeat-associated protein